MGKGKKPTKPSVPSDEPAARSDAAAAAAKRRNGKAGNAFPWHISLVVLLVAVGVTYLVTRSPAAPPVGNLGSKAGRASSSLDSEFQPQSRDEQCNSWKADGECENSPCCSRGLKSLFTVLTPYRPHSRRRVLLRTCAAPVPRVQISNS